LASADGLRAHCREKGLAGYKLPQLLAAQHVPLPTNSNGKILKRDVQALLLSLSGRTTDAVSRL
jgi:non-ribosomal peptide synthetase component E (peptide arylation enzyme)